MRNWEKYAMWKKQPRMKITKFDIGKFNGSIDFGWYIWTVLVHQGLGDTLKGEATLPPTMSSKE